MDLYLTSRVTGIRLRFPLLPDKISVKTGANVISLNIIRRGEVKIPRGNTITGYSWSGVIPGSSMRNLPFVHDWQDPLRIIDMLGAWEDAGERLNLMLTETYINDDVFIESFTWDVSGLDRVNYSLTLTQYRPLTVQTMPAPAVTVQATAAEGGTTEYRKGVVANASRVKYREGPGSEYAVLGKLAKGTEVTIYETSGDWYKINQEPAWWIKSSYVKVDGDTTRSTSKRRSSRRSGSGGGGSTGTSPELDVTGVATSRLTGVRDTGVRTRTVTLRSGQQETVRESKR